ncbi:hypothetical protein M3201_22530 [Paenibacillus motobuensis]|nr:hypothetical protein [Paenibacillus lutimineralis]MCM3649540.1 hypothetical protein [Paenibacillus motobuensis]
MSSSRGIPGTPRKIKRSAAKGDRLLAPRLYVEGQKQNPQAFNNNLTRPPRRSWL